MLKDGHWRAHGEEGEKSAWEESTRLRERMFWNRIGGGVVPAFLHNRDKEDGRPESTGSKDEVGRSSEEVEKREADMWKSNEKKVSIGSTVISAQDAEDVKKESMSEPKEEPATPPESDVNQHDSTSDKTTRCSNALSRDSIKSNTSVSATLSPESSRISSPKLEKRLSITIPGSFDK
jgi:hypothetical protein